MKFKNLKFKNQKSGTTLVELLLVIGIFALLLISIAGFFIMTVQGRGKSQAHIEAQEQARFAMQKMTYEIRRAASVNGNSNLNVNFASSSAYTFSLVEPTSGVSRSPTVFSVVSGILYEKQGAGTSTALTSKDVSVTNLMFTNLSSGKSKNILVNLTISKPDPTGNASLTINYPLETSIEIEGK